MPKRSRRVSARDQEVREQIGAAIRRARVSRGKSIRWLASEVNVDETMMGRIEKGRVSISTDILDRVAIALDTTVLSFYHREVA